MKTRILTLLFIGIFIGSCTDNFEDFNTDKKNPANVEGEALFTQAQKELSDQISSTNVNWNVWKLFVQYWTETTYTDEANYDIVNRGIPEQVFTAYYRYILNHLNEASSLISEDPLTGSESEASKTNKLMIIELLKIYSYHNLVNIFGDIPYSEALNTENINPNYDDAETVYADLMTRIDNAINELDESAHSFGNADLIYGGDVVMWLKFANSLKLKMAIILADVQSSTAQSNVESAVAAGVFTSAADNALFPYQSSTPNTNPLHEDLVLSGRSDFVPANTLVDLMVELDDPRLDDYFKNKLDTTDNDVNDPVWIGGTYGYSNSYANNSHISDYVAAATFPGILMTFNEVQFYIAEAAARGWDVGQTAEEAYNTAVTASVIFWNGTEEEADDYLAQESVTYDAGNWEDLIATQSYVAFYTRGLVAFNQLRRFDHPEMNEPEIPRTVDGSVPTRFTYPVNEQTLNADNYNTAAEAIGGDELTTRLFWDTSAPE